MESLVAQFCRGWHWWLARGVIALLFAVLVTCRPITTFSTLLVVFGTYLLLDGLALAAIAARDARRDGRWRMLAANALLSIIFGIVCLALPSIAALTMVYLWVVWALLTGILQIEVGAHLHLVYDDGWPLTLCGITSVVLGLIFALIPRTTASGLSACLDLYAVIVGWSLAWLGARLGLLATVSSRRTDRSRSPLQPPVDAEDDARVRQHSIW